MKKLIAIGFIVLIGLGCKKEKIYTYEVNEINVEQPGAVKPNVKNDQEFISISYTDLFGSTISPDALADLSLAYIAFGDKRTIIDMIILNFLNDTNADIPSQTEMDADIEKFVEDSYKKFFVREPTAFEKWWMKDKIENDATVTPELVWYGFMTSNEYRYY